MRVDRIIGKKKSFISLTAAGILGMTGLTSVASATTTVISTTVTGHASLVNSGSDNKNFWGQGGGAGTQYSGFGASAYSQATGGQISPFDLNVRDAHTDIFVANLQPGGKSISVSVTGGVLTQVGKDQVYVAESLDIGTPSPSFYTSPEPVSGSANQILNYAHFLYPIQGTSYSRNQGTTTIVVPTPEPASLLMFLGGAAGLVILGRKLRPIC